MEVSAATRNRSCAVRNETHRLRETAHMEASALRLRHWSEALGEARGITPSWPLLLVFSLDSDESGGRNYGVFLPRQSRLERRHDHVTHCGYENQRDEISIFRQ
jgi:hypothetical protein